MKALIVALSIFACGGVAACGDSGHAPPPSERVAAANEDLTLGSRGDAVRAVTQSLTAFGYFPNAKLAGNFPAWQPVVPLAPADASVFDDRTAQAVHEFQARSGLPQTGIVDQAMRALLQQPRCGDPDGARLDPTDKFAREIDILGATCNKWNISTVNFSVFNAAPGVSKANTQAAANAAAQTWNLTAGGWTSPQGIGHVGTINIQPYTSGSPEHRNPVGRPARQWHHRQYDVSTLWR